MPRTGSGKKNASNKQAFVDNVAQKLVQNPQSFLHLANYNDIKRWMRQVDGCIAKYVDNGQSFLDIVTKSLQRAGDPRLTQKFLVLQAAHRAQKVRDRGTGSSACLTLKTKMEAPKSTESSAAAHLPSTTEEKITSSSAPLTSTLGEKITAATDWKTEAKPSSSSSSLPPGRGMDVYYGKTDNERGCKEYTCVVIKTSNGRTRPDHCATEGLYFPKVGSRYKIINEVPMNRMKEVCGGEFPHMTGFVSSPFKERVLEYCDRHPETKSVFNYSLFPHAMR